MVRMFFYWRIIFMLIFVWTTNQVFSQCIIDEREINETNKDKTLTYINEKVFPCIHELSSVREISNIYDKIRLFYEHWDLDIEITELESKFKSSLQLHVIQHRENVKAREDTLSIAIISFNNAEMVHDEAVRKFEMVGGDLDNMSETDNEEGDERYEIFLELIHAKQQLESANSIKSNAEDELEMARNNLSATNLEIKQYLDM